MRAPGPDVLQSAAQMRALRIAIVAAIALTLRGRKDTRRQDPSAQLRVRREDRVRLVSMPSERDK